MKNILIGSLVAIGVIVLIVFIYTQMKAMTEKATRISDDVITRYVTLLQKGDYEQAYETCLDARYKKEVTLEAFANAHAERTKEHGALQAFEDKDFQQEANLFTSESLIGFNWILHYEKRDVFVLYKVDTTLEPYRILETLGGDQRSDFVSSGIW